jgi:hypothetical protein
MAVYQQQAERQGCDFSAIEINDKTLDTTFLIIDNVPFGSTVVLLAGQTVSTVSANDFENYLVGSEVRPSLSAPPMEAGSHAAQHALDDLADRVRRHRWNTSNDRFGSEPFSRHIPNVDQLLQSYAAEASREWQSLLTVQVQELANQLAGSHTTAPLDQQTLPRTPLAVLERWLTLPQAVTQSRVWKDIVDPSPVAAKLAELFSDLSNADRDGSKGLKALLSSVARTMAVDSDFAQQILALAPDVERVCADRVSYTAYQLQTALMVREASAPDSSQHMVMAIARHVYRRKWIYDAAHAKVKAINKGKETNHLTSHTEELETQWAYVVHFTQKGLELGGDVKHEGRFISEFISKVSPEDAHRSLDQLTADEAEHFVDFLALWTPWQEFLRRTCPHDVEALEAKLRDTDRASQFDREATDQLKNIGIDPSTSPAEVRQLANQLSKHDELTQWKRLTEQVLQVGDVERTSRWDTLSSTRSRSPSSDLAPRTPAASELFRV